MSPTSPSTCLGLGRCGEGTAQKRDGVSKYEEDTDTDEGDEEDIQLSVMYMDN